MLANLLWLDAFMIVRCALCNVPLKDKERVTGIISAWYRELPSKVAYAVYDQGMQLDKSSIAHYNCEKALYEA